MFSKFIKIKLKKFENNCSKFVEKYKFYLVMNHESIILDYFLWFLASK